MRIMLAVEEPASMTKSCPDLYGGTELNEAYWLRAGKDLWSRSFPLLILKGV